MTRVFTGREHGPCTRVVCTGLSGPGRALGDGRVCVCDCVCRLLNEDYFKRNDLWSTCCLPTSLVATLVVFQVGYTRLNRNEMSAVRLVNSYCCVGVSYGLFFHRTIIK